MITKLPKSLKILILEDDPGTRMIIGEILNLYSYQTLPVSGAQEALDYIGENTHHQFLVFVDLVMPGMTGWEFLKRVQSLRNQVKMRLIVITGAHPSFWKTAVSDSDE